MSCDGIWLTRSESALNIRHGVRRNAALTRHVVCPWSGVNAWCSLHMNVACCRFVVSGGLSLAVEGPSKAEIVCQDNDDGTCTVTYLPTEPGLYNVVVKFDDDHIVGSPFTAYIAGKYTKRKFQQRIRR